MTAPIVFRTGTEQIQQQASEKDGSDVSVPSCSSGERNQRQQRVLNQVVRALSALKTQAVILQTKGEKNTYNF